MKNAPVFAVFVFALGAFFVAQPAHATTVFGSQTVHSIVHSTNNTPFISGSFTSSATGFVKSMSLWFDATSTMGSFQITLNDSTKGALYVLNPSAVLVPIDGGYPSTGFQSFSFLNCYDLNHGGVSYGGGCPVSAGDSVSWAATFNAITAVTAYGSSPADSDAFYIVADDVVFDWSALSFPLIYDPNAQAIATSSSLWGLYASSSALLTQTCSTSNNPLDFHFYSGALCEAAAFLFMPNPNVLALGATLQADAQTRIPFSWASGIGQMYSISTASSTTNMISLVIDFSSADPASSTPFHTFLPRWEVFGTSTILKYIGSSRWAFFQLLMSGAIWLGLGTMMWFEVRYRTHKV